MLKSVNQIPNLLSKQVKKTKTSQIGSDEFASLAHCGTMCVCDCYKQCYWFDDEKETNNTAITLPKKTCQRNVDEYFHFKLCSTTFALFRCS